MANFYPPFELAEKAGKKVIEIDAPDLDILMKKGGEMLGVDLYAESKKWAVLVNGRNIRFLQSWKTPLKADDDVFFISGSGGG